MHGDACVGSVVVWAERALAVIVITKLTLLHAYPNIIVMLLKSKYVVIKQLLNMKRSAVRTCMMLPSIWYCHSRTGSGTFGAGNTFMQVDLHSRHNMTS